MNNTLQADLLFTYAKYTGLLYVMIAITGGFSIGYVPSVIIADGDALQTSQNILQHKGLFILGIIGDILVLIFEILITALLYTLFKPINPNLALAAAFARLGMVMVMALNLLNYLIPLHLLSLPEYLNVFTEHQLQALAFLLLEAHQYGVYIWGIFFGLHLLLLGQLVCKSGYVPKVFAILLSIGSFGYLLESLYHIAALNNSLISMLYMALLAVVTIGEILFAFWLLIKGINKDKVKAITA